MKGLWFVASGPDNLELARAVGTWASFAAVPETVVLDYRTEKRGSANWLEVARKCRTAARVWASRPRRPCAQPIANVRFIFVDGEARARAHLHELWLRELECWAIVEGVEKRLDADYAPVRPAAPGWAHAARR